MAVSSKSTSSQERGKNSKEKGSVQSIPSRSRPFHQRSKSPHRFSRSPRRFSRSPHGHSRSPHRHSRSPYRSRSPHQRSRSPYHKRRSPRPRLPFPYRKSRSRSPYNRHGHMRSPPRRRRSRSPYRHSPNRYHRSPHREFPNKFKYLRREKPDSEKVCLEKLRQAIDKIEKLAASKLQHYEQQPEKHPEYAAEWKKFWTQRYKEVQAEGKDPQGHDFKKEWAVFWIKRIQVLHEEDVTRQKEEVKKQLGFFGNEPFTKVKSEEPSPKNLYRKRSPISQQKPATVVKKELSPQKEIPSDMIYTLRLLTALENLLGSLGPQVNSLLATASLLEKSSPGSSQSLLKDNSVVVLLETVSEKLKGSLLARIVADNLEGATHKCIACLSKVLKTVPPTVIDPVAQERAIIASQIAAALVAQGKHDVTQEQLEGLINTVISMAQSSQKQETNKNMDSVEAVTAMVKPGTSEVKVSDAVISGLQMLQSAYEGKRSPKLKSATSSRTENLEDLSEEDLRVLLRNFKELSCEEQQGLILLLKKMEMNNPEKVERLRKYVAVDAYPQPVVSATPNRKASPLSLCNGSLNPPPIESKNKLDSDSDDDYNFMDILAAASKNVEENEQKKKELAEKKEKDALVSLRETKEKVASMLGALPPKLSILQPKPAIPQQPAPVTTTTAISNASTVPAVQQQSRYRYSAENPRQAYPNTQSSVQNVAPVTNIIGYSGRQQITASASYSVGYADQYQSSASSSHATPYSMQQQQQQQQHQTHQQLEKQPHQKEQQPYQLHQQQQQQQEPQQMQQHQQQQWTSQNYKSSNIYNPHQQSYNHMQSYSRQQYY